jgi:peptidoglycan lytic transglycosylase G
LTGVPPGASSTGVPPGASSTGVPPGPLAGGGDPRRKEPGRRRWPWILAALLVAFALVIGGGLWWIDRQVNPPGGAGRPVDVTLPAASSASQVADQLARSGVIASSFVFKLYLRVEGSESVTAGTYVLHQHQPYGQLLGALAAGPPVHRLTIPEGFTLAQIAARVGRIPGHSASSFLAEANSGAVRSPYEPPGSTSLEGLLFPDTYSVGVKDSDAQILTRMVDRFDQVASGVGLDQAATQVGLSPYQAVIVASIVEREAKLDGDRGKVARVVYNRLSKDMRLQIDSTVIYGLGGHVTSLTKAQLAEPTPYNTYLITGLPPTPIANPGVPSLQAALAPTPGPWLYYVVTSPDGGESFAATYPEQQANIKIARARGLD